MRRGLFAALVTLGALLAPGAHATIIVVPTFSSNVPYLATRVGDYGKIHTVAVVSAIGTAINLTTVHFMGPTSKPLSISDWAIDQATETVLRKYLSPRFAFKDVAFDRAALASIANGRWDNNLAFKAYLRTLPTDGIDAFIVLRPDQEDETPGAPGLSLTHGSGFGDTYPVLWANYEIDIVDAHSYELLGKAYSRIALRKGEAPTFAGLVLSTLLRTGDDLVLTDLQTKILRGITTRLVQRSEIETLRALSLGVPLPDAGARVLVPRTDDARPDPPIRSIAVVSTIGDRLQFKHWGAFFAHGEDYVPVPDWGIDALVERKIGAALDPRIAVKDIAVDRAAAAGARLFDDDGNVAPSFPGLVPTDSVDAYLVAVKTISEVPMLGRACRGLGVWHWTPVGDEQTKVFAAYALVVLDAKTLKIRRVVPAVLSPDHASADPFVDVSNALWPGSPPHLTDEQSHAIAEDLRGFIGDTIPEAMLDVGLTDKMMSDDLPPAN